MVSYQKNQLSSTDWPSFSRGVIDLTVEDGYDEVHLKSTLTFPGDTRSGNTPHGRASVLISIGKIQMKGLSNAVEGLRYLSFRLDDS